MRLPITTKQLEDCIEVYANHYRTTIQKRRTRPFVQIMAKENEVKRVRIGMKSNEGTTLFGMFMTIELCKGEIIWT